MASLGTQFPWVLVLRGILAVLFGVLAFVMPFATLAALVLVFGAFALVDGVFALAAATRAHGLGLSPWPYLIEGVSGVAAGLATFIVPTMTALVLLMLIAAWAIVAGVFRLVAAVRLRRVIRHDWLLVLSGLVAIAFGVLTVLRPAAAALGIVLVLGAYSIVFGALFIGLGLRLRRGTTLAPA